MSRIIEGIGGPADLKAIPEEELEGVCRELREYVVEVITAVGGHLGASLGVVELTVALHRVFDSPRDVFCWDVGHQGYIHKILTGRRERFPTIRQHGGLSGFLKRSESEPATPPPPFRRPWVSRRPPGAAAPSAMWWP